MAFYTVHVGIGGISYRHTFSQDRDPAPVAPSPATYAPLQAIDSVSAAGIVDSSSEELIEEIRAKRRRGTRLPLAILSGVVCVLVGLGAGWPPWAVATAILAAVALAIYTARSDRIAKTVVVFYDFEPRAEEAFRRFTEWAAALAASQRMWSVEASGHVLDRKYHAGASALVQRSATRIRTEAPPMLKTNVPVLSVGVGRQTLYFLPDRLLVYDRVDVGAVSYRTLDVVASKQRFIEDGAVPSDAMVVDRTWRYVNKNGGPDRRFNANPQLPICLYDELTLRTGSGLHEIVQVSRPGVAEGFAAAIRYLGDAVS